MKDIDKINDGTEEIIIPSELGSTIVLGLLNLAIAFGFLIYFGSIVLFIFCLFVSLYGFLYGFTKKSVILDKKLQRIFIKSYLNNALYSLKEIPFPSVKNIRVTKTHLPATENFDEGESWSTEIVTCSGASVSIYSPSGQSGAIRVAERISSVTKAEISYKS